MTVADLIAALQQYDPGLQVFVADDQEPDLSNLLAMRPEYVRPCAIRYLHRDRAPKVVAGVPNAIFVGPSTPEVWAPPKY